MYLHHQDMTMSTPHNKCSNIDIQKYPGTRPSRPRVHRARHHPFSTTYAVSQLQQGCSYVYMSQEYQSDTNSIPIHLVQLQVYFVTDFCTHIQTQIQQKTAPSEERAAQQHTTRLSGVVGRFRPNNVLDCPHPAVMTIGKHFKVKTISDLMPSRFSDGRRQNFIHAHVAHLGCLC